MNEILLILLLAVGVNAGCILTFDRAQRALRDLGAIWVKALTGKPVSSSHSV